MATLSLVIFSASLEAAKCNPDGICKACKDCSKCAYCSSGKGSCSVCRNQTPEESRKREAKRERNGTYRK